MCAVDTNKQKQEKILTKGFAEGQKNLTGLKILQKKLCY